MELEPEPIFAGALPDPAVVEIFEVVGAAHDVVRLIATAGRAQANQLGLRNGIVRFGFDNQVAFRHAEIHRLGREAQLHFMPGGPRCFHGQCRDFLNDAGLAPAREIEDGLLLFYHRRVQTVTAGLRRAEDDVKIRIECVEDLAEAGELDSHSAIGG